MKPLVQATHASVVLGTDGRGLRGRQDKSLRTLEHISLCLLTGERVAVVGSNGAGKSTLLRLLHGLVQVCEGSVVRAPALRQAMLFQRPHMLRMSVGSHVALGLWLRGKPWEQAKRQALDVLDQLGLGSLAPRKAQTLSGGQQQRVAIARAWALEPQLLLLDEPTASLDPYAKGEVENLLQAFCQTHAEATVVFASHNLGQVKRMATRVMYLERGRLLADLPVEQFFDPLVLQAHCPSAHHFLKGELL